MKPRLNPPACTAESADFDLRPDDAAVAPDPIGSLHNQCSPIPLWEKARIRSIGFRRDDLAQAHWRKVWRYMLDE